MGTLNTTDLNTVIIGGKYKAFFSTIENASQYNFPIAGTITIVVVNHGNLIAQFVYGSGGAATRSGSLSGGSVKNWEAWTRLDNFGCNDLSSLATALGVAQYHTYLNSGDFDTLLEPGTWLCNPNTMTNKPTNVENGQGILEVIKLGTTGVHLVQRLTMKANGDVYIRCNNSTSSPYTFFEWTKH